MKASKVTVSRDEGLHGSMTARVQAPPTSQHLTHTDRQNKTGSDNLTTIKQTNLPSISISALNQHPLSGEGIDFVKAEFSLNAYCYNMIYTAVRLLFLHLYIYIFLFD